MTLQQALDNYQRERLRLDGGHYPHPACGCGFCDVVRAADLLYQLVTAAVAEATAREFNEKFGRR